METAHWLLSKVISKLSDQLVADYVSSSELGPNFQKIKIELLATQALLYQAQQRDLSDNLGLQGLVQELSNKADEAEDALDELHYFKIQDELDDTQDATPDLGDGLRSQAQHVRHVVRHNAGNWFPCFTCCRSQDDVAAATHNTDKGKHQTDAIVSHGDKRQLDRVAMSDSGSDEHAQKLPFDRVAMSNKIKQLIEEIHSLCDHITKQPQISTSSNPQRVIGDTLKRPITSSTITQKKFYGRDVIYEKTIGDLKGGQETLSVLPIVGPGGIGKTTFTQRLFHDGRIQEVFPVKIWVCVSNNFDILRLTQEILCCILAEEKEDTNKAYRTTNLSVLHKDIEERLKSKRFLLVLDDMWECNKRDRDNLLGPFAKGETKGNMVLVTTRKESVAEMMKSKQIDPIKLRGLEPDKFWEFFQDCAFGEVKDEDKHDLIGIGKAISDKLKCSPLAAKTVGPLLQKNFSQDHWIGILNNKEWENLKHPDDIMPALQISYDYLPFYLKKCFSYCALFPEDHKFYILELSRFWDAMGIIDAGGQTNRAEVLVDELVGNGFLIRQDDGSYMLHDLLHELSQCVSSQECVNISFNGFVADKIPRSVRHISITIQNKCAKNIEEEMNKLKGRIDIGNLRTLMIFASNIHHGDIYYGSRRHANILNVCRRDANILKDTFNEVKDLRVLFIFMLSPESLPCNFSKLIHLRYLKIQTFSSVSLPSAISRFYHLKFLILQNTNNTFFSDYTNNAPKDFNRLVNLRHIQASNEFQSSIPEVGKMKCLEVLNEFCVKKKSVGFELAELGKLANLGGHLSIRGLEKLKNKEEAEEALLKNKCNLKGLALEFSRTEQTTGHDAIEGLQPHPDLKELDIKCHRCATGPSWLCHNICVTKLECLCLVKISWDVLPPFGRLPLLRSLELREICGLRQFRLDSYGVIDGSFKHFKTIKFCDMPDLVEWIGGDNSHLFSKLEDIVLSCCPSLTTLPFSDGNVHPIEITHIKWFPCLRKLKIRDCPKLSHLPPVPYTSTLTSVEVSDNWHETLRYRSVDNSLVVWGYYGALAFDNLGKIEYMSISDGPHILLTDLQKLSSLRQLRVKGDMFSGEVGDGVVIPSVHELTLERFHPTRRLLSNVFKCLPALSKMTMGHSNEDQEELILQFPPSNLLHEIYMYHCKNMIFSAEGGGAFRDLTSLQSLTALSCGKIFSQWFSAEASEVINTFPSSIRKLTVWGSFPEFPDNLLMALLSNLTFITHLTHLSLKGLKIRECGSVAADLLALPVPAASWQLEFLSVDVPAVLVDPICSRLSATLRRLSFYHAGTIEGFTEEQEKALQRLIALEALEFNDCRVLQSLPETIDRLYSLKKLIISGCPKIRCLPKCGLPTSLEFLEVPGCSDELRTELWDLIETRPDFEIVF